MSIRVENQITTCHQKKYICAIKEGYKGIAIINTIYIKRKGSVNQHIKLNVQNKFERRMWFLCQYKWAS